MDFEIRNLNVGWDLFFYWDGKGILLWEIEW